MAFRARMPRDLAFADQHLSDGPAIIGSVDSLDSAAEPATKPFALAAAAAGEGGGPSWLSASSLSHHGSVLHLQSHSDSSPSPGAAVGQWFPLLPVLRRDAGDDEDLAADDPAGEEGSVGGEVGEGTWRSARYKAEIMAHPLYEQLLSAHVACLRIATPVDQLPRIDEKLAQTQHVVSKYSALGAQMLSDDKELDQFMTQYVLLLRSFKEQLQQHVRVHAMEAVMACWELEQSLQSLTGISPGEGTGATMSDDDEEQDDSEANMFDGSLDGSDSMGFGPLVPSESERTLMERVRLELKHELKQGYKEKIVDIREEILRKRRAGKLPCDTTSTLKGWWQTHSKWPYPTEEDKARLVQETGLQLKQINNWFINQRKRNWHSNPTSSSTSKSKRKRYKKARQKHQISYQLKLNVVFCSYFGHELSSYTKLRNKAMQVIRSNFDSKLLGSSTMKRRLVFKAQ